MKNIVIAGGGIIGLCSAYYLNQSGFKVTVLDRTDIIDGCSFGNAGMIVPSHIIPLAAPGMISRGFRWMFQPSSPFFIRPRLSMDLLRWGYYFYKSSNQENVDKAVPALRDISLLSRTLYADMSNSLPFDFGFRENGLLMLYQTGETEKEEIASAKIANDNGVNAIMLDAGEVQRLEPDVTVKVRGGVYFPGDAHVTPHRLIRQLIPYLKEKGVNFVTGKEILDFHLEQRKVKSLITQEGSIECEELILAAGAWSGLLGSRLGLSIPVQAGKGYSFTMQDVKNNIRVPSIFLEERVAVTPMGDALRFGGTMEITGIDHRVNMNRVMGIVNAIPRYYPELRVPPPAAGAVWHGLRPCSPDGLPYIGRAAGLTNVTIATGHAMMGLSLGPATGKLISEIIKQEKTSVDIRLFGPGRF